MSAAVFVPSPPDAAVVRTLATVAAERAGCARRAAMGVIDEYTGTDPATHRWRFVVRARGAKVFELLEPPSASGTT